jgi:hypothetical protein
MPAKVTTSRRWSMITPEAGFLLFALALAALGALLWAALLHSRVRALQARLEGMERTLQQSTEWYQSLSEGALGQGQHLVQVRQDLDRLKDRIEQIAVSDPAGSAFSHAIRMARRGCPAAEIMETCGLSRVEADLVVLLHRSEQTP